MNLNINTPSICYMSSYLFEKMFMVMKYSFPPWWFFFPSSESCTVDIAPHLSRRSLHHSGCQPTVPETNCGTHPLSSPKRKTNIWRLTSFSFHRFHRYSENIFIYLNGYIHISVFHTSIKFLKTSWCPTPGSNISVAAPHRWRRQRRSPQVPGAPGIYGN